METILVAVFDTENNARDASRALDALSDADVIGVNATRSASPSARPPDSWP